MKYIVVQIDDGGADTAEYSNPDHVIAYLNRGGDGVRAGHTYWREDAIRFGRKLWVPGQAMVWSCGWIFCVLDSVAL